MNTDHYKAKLLTQQAEYEARIAKLNEQQQNQDKNLQEHWDDQAIIARQNDLQNALLAEAQSELDKVNNALLRIENDRYGVCAQCDEPIDERRLEAMPIATTCADYA